MLDVANVLIPCQATREGGISNLEGKTTRMVLSIAGIHTLGLQIGMNPASDSNSLRANI